MVTGAGLRCHLACMEPTDQQLPEAVGPTPRRRSWARDLGLVAAGAAVAVAALVAVRPAAFSRAGDPSTVDGRGVGDVLAEAAATVQALAVDAPMGAAATSREGLGAFPVHDVNGATVPIIRAGEPAIVMINSRGCGYCRLALRDLGEYAGGRPVPRLRLLTLEGAAAGVPMLEAAGVNGAAPIGPATSQSQVLLTFRYRGTPTFVAVDADGRIRGTMPGYPGPERLASWFDVMLGASDLPAISN